MGEIEKLSTNPPETRQIALFFLWITEKDSYIKFDKITNWKQMCVLFKIVNITEIDLQRC
jgi:hypothetical protein